jgi:uncharacterized protein (DUF697 family)/tellurite resistance protein
MISLNTAETESIFALCLMASFADGQRHEDERAHLKKVAASLSTNEVDFAALHQEVLLKKTDMATYAARLQTPEARLLAYEMAVCVCDADDLCCPAEQRFLDQLRAALALPAASTQPVEAEAAAAALATLPAPSLSPSPATVQTEETDSMILRYAIAGGALELLPQTLATLAIVPLQIKMVYRIGSQRGFQLDRKSIVEFMGTVGIGLASQVFEGFARRLTGKLGKSMGGKMGGKIGDAVGGIAMSFGSTYALGQLAKLYYDRGRTLGLPELKSKFPELLADGKALAQDYTAQITTQSREFRGFDVPAVLNALP